MLHSLAFNVFVECGWGVIHYKCNRHFAEPSYSFSQEFFPPCPEWTWIFNRAWNWVRCNASVNTQLGSVRGFNRCTRAGSTQNYVNIPYMKLKPSTWDISLDWAIKELICVDREEDKSLSQNRTKLSLYSEFQQRFEVCTTVLGLNNRSSRRQIILSEDTFHRFLKLVGNALCRILSSILINLLEQQFWQHTNLSVVSSSFGSISKNITTEILCPMAWTWPGYVTEVQCRFCFCRVLVCSAMRPTVVWGAICWWRIEWTEWERSCTNPSKTFVCRGQERFFKIN